MQVYGVASFLLCTLSMFALFIEFNTTGIILFGVSLACLSLSLLTSLFEIHISCDAIEIELQSIEDKPLSNRITKNFTNKSSKALAAYFSKFLNNNKAMA